MPVNKKECGRTIHGLELREPYVAGASKSGSQVWRGLALADGALRTSQRRSFPADSYVGCRNESMKSIPKANDIAYTLRACPVPAAPVINPLRYMYILYVLIDNASMLSLPAIARLDVLGILRISNYTQ